MRLPAPANRLAVAALVVVASAMLTGCGKDSGEPIAFEASDVRNTTDTAGAPKRILTVTSLTGPSGAAPDQIKAGTYVAKGTYDLNGTKFDHGVITFSIEGSFDMITKQGLPENASIYELVGGHFEIPKGQLTGSFEVSFGIKKVKSDSTGSVTINFHGNQKLDESNSNITVHETVELKKK